VAGVLEGASTLLGSPSQVAGRGAGLGCQPKARADERVIAAQQELALLEAERDMIASGEHPTDDGRAMIQDATHTILELGDEET
jgi:hypothetical protein